MPAAVDPGKRVAELRRLVRTARQLGFSSIWALHHHISNVPTFQPLPLLAALSGDARGMTLGTGVLVLPLCHPVAVAEDFASLDVLSGGRVVLGAGIGYHEPEFRAFNVPMAGRGARLEEEVRIIRALWGGSSVSTDDPFFRLQDVRLSLLPEQPGGPAIWLGGVSDRAIERAARIADGWLLPPDLDVPTLGKRISTYRREMEAQDREVQVLPLQRECLIAEGGEALRDAKRYLRQNAAVYAARGMRWIEEQFDRWLEGSYLIGSVAEVGERVQRLADLGITEIHMRVGWGDAPFDVMLQTVELAGKSVV